jgi:hypothetical protein
MAEASWKRTVRSRATRLRLHTRQNECEHSFVEREKFDYARSAKHTVVALGKYRSLFRWRRFSSCVRICVTNLFDLFTLCRNKQHIYRRKHSAELSSPCFSPSPRTFHPLSVPQAVCNPRSQSGLRCYRVNWCCVLPRFAAYVIALGQRFGIKTWM